MTKGCIAALYVKHLLEHQTASPFKNCGLARQRQRQGRRATTWTRTQSKALGGADVMGSATCKVRSHVADQGEYAVELRRCFDKNTCRELYSTS